MCCVSYPIYLSQSKTMHKLETYAKLPFLRLWNCRLATLIVIFRKEKRLLNRYIPTKIVVFVNELYVYILVAIYSEQTRTHFELFLFSHTFYSCVWKLTNLTLVHNEQ